MCAFLAGLPEVDERGICCKDVDQMKPGDMGIMRGQYSLPLMSELPKIDAVFDSRQHLLSPPRPWQMRASVTGQFTVIAVIGEMTIILIPNVGIRGINTQHVRELII